MAQGDGAKYQITQFTTKEGLLSNTVHEVVLDEEGFLWIAMDGGLMRFDGSNFRSYGKEVALENHTLIHMQLDSKGNLWMHSTSGDVFVKSKGNDKVKLYHNNDKIKSLFRNSAGFSRKLFYVDTLGNLYLENLSKDEVYSIDSEGFIKVLSNDNQPGTDVITLPDGHFIPVPNLKNEKGVQYFASGSSGRQLDFDERIHDVRYNGLHFEVPYNMDFLTTSANAIFQINEDTLVHYCCGKVSVFTEDTLFSQKPSGLILDFKISDEREIFAGYHYREGVVVAKDLQAFTKGEFANFLKGYSVTSISVAGNNSFWVGTLEGGIFYFKQPIVFSVFKDMKIISLKNVGDSLLFMSNGKDLFYSNGSLPLNLRNLGSFKEIRSINFSPEQNRVFISALSSKYINLPWLTKLNQIPVVWKYFADKEISVKLKDADGKKIKSFGKDKVVVIGSSRWMLFNKLDSFPIYNSSLHGRNESLRLNDVVEWEGDLVFSTDTGLLKEVAYDLVPFDLGLGPDFSRITQLDLWEGRLLLVSPYKGIQILDSKGNWARLDLGVDFMGARINRVVPKGENELLLCTNKGLSIASISGDSLYIKKHLSESDGLSDNEVLDAATFGENVYISTEFGLDYGKLSNLPDRGGKVFVEYINGNYLGVRSDSLVTSDITYEDDVVINYVKLHRPNDVFNQFRYRLNDGNWIYTRSNEVRFSSLTPGTYKFEVCVQNSKGDWTNCDEVSFLKLNLWYLSWQFILLTILTGFGLLAFYFRRRIHMIKERQSIERQILDLERKALNAQMNPHFIFNLLNSIQSFIYFNDKKVAMKYLSMFARFLRQNLVASSESFITLQEELSLIRNYLELEELGQKGKFTFEVKCDCNTSPAFLTIPPMLVQPFVENAVKHGMKGKETGGKIEVIYRQVNDFLEITIRDNGPGMNEADIEKPDSYGIKLTRQRLQLINQKNVPPVKFLSGPNGGTEVRLHVSWAPYGGTPRTEHPGIVEN